MKYLLVNEQNVIVYISDMCNVVSNGFQVQEMLVFAPNGLHVEEVENVPEGVTQQHYCYTQADGFYENVNYVDPAISMQQERPQ